MLNRWHKKVVEDRNRERFWIDFQELLILVLSLLFSSVIVLGLWELLIKGRLP